MGIKVSADQKDFTIHISDDEKGEGIWIPWDLLESVIDEARSLKRSLRHKYDNAKKRQLEQAVVVPENVSVLGYNFQRIEKKDGHYYFFDNMYAGYTYFWPTDGTFSHSNFSYTEHYPTELEAIEALVQKGPKECCEKNEHPPSADKYHPEATESLREFTAQLRTDNRQASLTSVSTAGNIYQPSNALRGELWIDYKPAVMYYRNGKWVKR